MPNPLLSVVSQKSNLITPDIKNKIKSMYKLYSGDPNGFIQTMLANNPSLKNNPMLMSAINGNCNVQQVVGGLLNNAGLSEEEFKSLLQ